MSKILHHKIKQVLVIWPGVVGKFEKGGNIKTLKMFLIFSIPPSVKQLTHSCDNRKILLSICSC